MDIDELRYVLDMANAIPSTDNDALAERARWVLADTLGVALAGGRRPRAQAFVDGNDVTGAWGTPTRTRACPASLLTASEQWADTERAAYINGSIVGDLELDEGVRPTGHPAGQVVPAVLAAGEAIGATMAGVLDALVVGYEVAAHMFETFTLTPGIHPHGHIGAIGAAAAIAHLRDVDPLPPVIAAATMPLATTWASCRDGATVRNTWMGHAAAAGLTAHRLADSGWQGSWKSFDTLFDGLLGREEPAPYPDVRNPRVLTGYFKFFSACALTHSSIEASIQIAPLDPVQVDHVSATVNVQSMKISSPPNPNPLSRRFSVPFAVAAALTRGIPTVADFDDPTPDVLDLSQRVYVNEEPEFTQQWPQAAPARITVRLSNGTQLDGEVVDARGTPHSPATAQDLRRKSTDLLCDNGHLWDTLSHAAQSAPICNLLQSAITRYP